MITEDKITELFCMADDFCQFFDAMMEKYTLRSAKKRRYHCNSPLPKVEIILIMILSHDSGYHCLKHFYLEKVCKHLRHLFPKVVSYNCFVELEKENPMGWFFGFKLHLVCNEKGELLNFMITSGDVGDRQPLEVV